MTKHTIEIKCLPEGWEPVAYRAPKYDENYLAVDGLVETCQCCMYVPHLIVQKTKPREITIVETDDDIAYPLQQVLKVGDVKLKIDATKIWRIKEE